MKYIEVDEELYRFIAGKTERIGESASDILRRLIGLDVKSVESVKPQQIAEPSLENETKATPEDVSSTIDFTSLFITDEISSQKGAVGRFIYVLEQLHSALPNKFNEVLQIQGRGRLYFATSKKDLLKASKSSNPKQIGQSSYWVTTNNNTAKKQAIFSEVLVRLGCSPEKAQELVHHI
ncbi:replication initiation negative regulator SeqA [Parashewanella curva]|uniref:Negative modulator of initiation of replication n=1 Tax=Parashewanella curva TaxID=2338552 RepID=A0A3L8PUB3_9GAMM|nr:replication initiation negative regulator SeqA [Parashewanella curva]RLV58894.1 replication initiation negative regulator SeqA [Parashewanella curva]